MLTITTTNINNRDDWYHAWTPFIKGTPYHAWETSRHAAFMAVARQLAVAGYINGLAL